VLIFQLDDMKESTLYANSYIYTSRYKVI